MVNEGRNHRLERLMDQAGFTSHKSLARAVVNESTLVNGPFKRCDHTDVARWIKGMTPRGTKPAIIAAAISRKLGREVTLAEIGMASSVAVMTPHLGLAYPQTTDLGTNNIAGLWHADLDEASQIIRAQIDPSAWNAASLQWLISREMQRPDTSHASTRVSTADVRRFRTTVEMFAQLDGRFGGGHGRQALIQYLATDGERLLRGRFTESVGKELYSAVSEATLLAAWMTYDSAPTGGLSQRYFIQALALADAGDDRLLGASILDAMSHQATFVGRFRDAANLAVAARTGTSGVATPTLTAHFHVMEARALARLGDAKACDSALTAADRIFERRVFTNDPEWIQYFDDAELAAEIGHCFRDLSRPADAAQHASHCLAATDSIESTRSRFFAAMVLADAHVAAGEVERGCSTTLEALKLGEQIRSARCISYLREFRELLAKIGSCPASRDFEEQAKETRLWRIASRPQS